MKISLDVSALDPGFKEHAQRGIGRYVGELKRYFESRPDLAQQISFFDHRGIGGKFGQKLAAICDYLPVARQTIKQQLVLPGCYRSAGNGQLFHFPAHMDAPACGMPPYLLTVLDLIPQVLPDLYKADRPNWRFKLARFLENQAIRKAMLLLCISECTARDVNRILGIPMERMRITYLGVDQKFFIQKDSANAAELLHKFNLEQDRPRILYVGGIDPRKNINFALEVIAELKRRFLQQGRRPPYLLMAGRIAADREFPKMKLKIRELGLDNDVKLLGFVEDSDLLQLYKISDVFFFPSLYEGFGLPPLEAMAAGLAVLSSDTSCMPEILGSAALLTDPTDLRSACEGLEKLCLDKNLNSEFAQKGIKQAAHYSWERTAELTLRAYREAGAF